jgi:arsenate reductase
MELTKSIRKYCDAQIREFDKIGASRKAKLNILAEYLIDKYQKEKTPKVIVICTHNSRRSHLGQIWLAVGADYFGLPKIETYSGGTEATAFNPRAVQALNAIGFDINTANKTAENPKYAIKWTIEMSPYIAFSTKYDEAPNPTKNFAAIMVCTDADEKCPLVAGMDLRLALPFEDPKAFDDTALESEKYSERCEQIAREFLYVLNEVKAIL